MRRGIGAVILVIVAGGKAAVGDGPPPAIDAPRELARWIGTDPPEGERWNAAQDDFHRAWYVALEHGRPIATLNRPARPRAVLPFAPFDPTDEFRFGGAPAAVRVDDGWIASFNRGEWGGSIWWFSPDGRGRRRIETANGNGFIPSKQGLLLLEGLAHGPESTGSVRRLDRRAGGRWAGETFADLGQAPDAATLDGPDALLVACSGSLRRVDLRTRRVEVLVPDAFWGGLYPTSIVREPNGPVWIGMRHGVARLDSARSHPSIRWYLPNRAVAEEKPVPGFH